MNNANLKAHIIGGRGRMGVQLKKYLEDQLWSVTVSGSSDDPKIELAQADVVFISVPIPVAPQVITKISKFTAPDCLLVDLSSIKSETVKALKKTGRPALLMHELFGPTLTSLYNQKIVFWKVKNHPLIKTLQKMFENSGAQIIYMRPKQHDIYMAHIQALTHFVNISLAHTLLENRIGLGNSISTPVYLAQLSALMRVVSQDPSLLAQFQLENSYYPEILEKHIDYQYQLFKLIKDKKYPHLKKQLAGIHKSIEPHKNHLPQLKAKPARKKEITGLDGKVAYLGPGGTFSHQAASMIVKDQQNLVPTETIYDIFESVVARRVDFGVVPAENSIDGTIRETLDFLIDFDLRTCGSVELQIHQNLLSKENTLEEVKLVISHPQALAQSRNWLKKHLPKAKTTTSRSTVSAILDQSKQPGVAFVGPQLAAKMYNLNVLAHNIEDHTSNVTKFYVICREGVSCVGCTRTLLFLTVFNRVGILRDILNVFANHDIDLTRLESRPSRQKLWDYHFFIETDVLSDDPRLVQSLNILRQYCPIIKVLGEI